MACYYTLVHLTKPQVYKSTDLMPKSVQINKQKFNYFLQLFMYNLPSLIVQPRSEPLKRQHLHSDVPSICESHMVVLCNCLIIETRGKGENVDLSPSSKLDHFETFKLFLLNHKTNS